MCNEFTNRISILFNWLNKKKHAQGALWAIGSAFLSCIYNVFIKLAGNRIPTMQGVFLQLFFGTIIISLFLLITHKKIFFISNKPHWYLIRAAIGFGGSALWFYGSSKTPLPTTTIISFTTPLFILPLAFIMLNEKVNWKITATTLLGFAGIIIILSGQDTINGVNFHFHPGIIILFLSVCFFSICIILNKKLLFINHTYSVLFYLYLGTTLFSILPAILVWQPIVDKVSFYFLILIGLAGVLSTYCLLKATKILEVTSLTPYKYSELLFSIIISYLLFKESIGNATIFGAIFISFSILVLSFLGKGGEPGS